MHRHQMLNMLMLTVLTITTLTAAEPEVANNLQTFRAEAKLELSLCIDRNFERCTTITIDHDQCITLGADLDNKLRSIMMPVGAGCTLYTTSGCHWERNVKPTYYGKSKADLRDCSWLGCRGGLELSVSSVWCKLYPEAPRY